MPEHRLKTWPHFFEMVWNGRKRFEVRKNDRNFQVGDKLILQEFDPLTGEYSGREADRHIEGIFDLEPIHEAVVLTFCWSGDSTDALTAELASAREWIKNHEGEVTELSMRLREAEGHQQSAEQRAEKAEAGEAKAWEEFRALSGRDGANSNQLLAQRDKLALDLAHVGQIRDQLLGQVAELRGALGDLVGRTGHPIAIAALARTPEASLNRLKAEWLQDTVIPHIRNLYSATVKVSLPEWSVALEACADSFEEMAGALAAKEGSDVPDLL